MSDTTNTAAPSAPAAEAPSTQQPAAAPSAPAKADANDPFWLNERLNRAAKQALKAAGIDVPKNVDPLEAAKDAAKKAEERKGERKRLREEAAKATAEAEQLRAQSEAQADVLKAFAAVEMAKLSDEEKATVTTVAKDNYAEQLKAISVLRARDKAQPPPAAAATQAPLQAPASTAPVTNAPAPGTPGAPEDYAGTYKTLKQQNPYLAAQYLDWHLNKIFPDRNVG